MISEGVLLFSACALPGRSGNGGERAVRVPVGTYGVLGVSIGIGWVFCDQPGSRPLIGSIVAA